MKHSEKTKNIARTLRKKGCSFSEIANDLGIAKSTASLWTGKIVLTRSAKNRITNLSITGRNNSVRNRHKKAQKDTVIRVKSTHEIIETAKINNQTIKIFCSLLYWGEGSKNDSCVRFTNSDPKMVSTFLSFFRKGFGPLDENKFRCVLQLHEYHTEKIEIDYWSQITKIPKEQFTKSYLKPHTGHILHPNYHGTIGVKYYDNKVLLQITTIYNILSDIGV